ncbi:23S rRNA (guanosine(2251)-2'-O)-methyltransferase RlmB [Pleomorphochaeta sp. DL1XJH-081]|jgi:23S rRNA (guanosine2251-2'-O)-methyltransferase|uniref:23S rRNA (guanosine(2251)-2'-O)-methyltransferase RlmB n=1 Tax=Pleomorphochaeta sp. DL1XJH-081 TaxID=3409690 RepID=UPI003BB4C512
MADRIFGFHAIEEALKEAPAGSTLFICRNMEKRNTRLESLARQNGSVAIRKIAKIEMDRMTQNADHRGAMLELGVTRDRKGSAVKQNSISVKDFLSTLPEDKPAVVLALDSITDVHNLGAILRSADQFSVDLVIVPERRSAQTNETVNRISSGAAQYVPVASVSNLVRELEQLQKHNFWVYGADMGGAPSYATKFPVRTVLVMGSEGDGLGQLVEKRCDHLISIPTSGHVDSLNVSVATGILLYEFRRQQPVHQ